MTWQIEGPDEQHPTSLVGEGLNLGRATRTAHGARSVLTPESLERNNVGLRADPQLFRSGPERVNFGLKDHAQGDGDTTAIAVSSPHSRRYRAFVRRTFRGRQPHMHTASKVRRHGFFPFFLSRCSANVELQDW